MKRAVIIIIDSMGIGAMPDAQKYGDVMECNTLCNVAKFNNGLKLPNLEKMGLGNIDKIQGVEQTQTPIASYGKMFEVSEGKDTTTGHWEIAGLILDEPFRTYPEGFPQFIIDEFIEKTGCKAILGNFPASGTAIIDQFGEEHIKTGFPIVYTSADSVFQVACHVDVTSIKKLHEWCEIARKILDSHSKEHCVCRVIARPFEGKKGGFKRISAGRRDYSVAPKAPTVLNKIEEVGGSVLGIGKIEDIFVNSGITKAIHTGTNKEGLELTIKALESTPDTEISLIFTNLVDTDMLYGHRNDACGYGKALEEIDAYLGKILPLITKDDLLIITADHGCDPTVNGTDHTRETVPVLIYNPEILGKNLGNRSTFADIASTVAKWLNVPFECSGISMI